MRLLPLLLALALSAPSFAQSGKPPTPTQLDEAQASRVLAMPSDSPPARLNQLLAARDLGPAAQFALAARMPGLVEQLVTREYQLALAYLDSLPAPELGRVRRGETVIRTTNDWKTRSEERGAAEALGEHYDLNLKKLEAVRIGPFENRVLRVEVTEKKGSGMVELVWPSTPERDDRSRERLAKHFGARPTQRAMGVGAPLPVEDGSFEVEDTIGRLWKLERRADLGGGTPVAEVSRDTKSAIDGVGSVRFYATEKSRLFTAATQQITVAPSTRLRATAQLRTENVRAQYIQNPQDLYLEIQFQDITGAPVGQPIRSTGALETHNWQPLEVYGEAPDGTAFVAVTLFCGLSGTAWFDGVTLEIAE